MPITDTDRIKDESTVSRHLQINIPKPDLDGTFIKHPQITRFDTNEKGIFDNLRTDEVTISNITVVMDEDDNFNVDVSTITHTVTEITPTSNKSEYNKVYSLFDREGHVFFIDWTPDNVRTHLRHPSGTYWTIDNSGTYNEKIENDYISIIKNNRKLVVDKDDNTLVKVDQKLSVGRHRAVLVKGNQDTHIGSSSATVIGAEEFKSIGKDKKLLVRGNYISRVSGYKEDIVDGFYVIKSTGRLLLESPDIRIKTNSFNLNLNGSSIDSIGGKKEISAAAISLNSLGNTLINSNGNLSVSIVGMSEEIIMGASVPPPPIAKKITVAIGDYKVETTLGQIILSALVNGVEIGNNIGMLKVSVAGDVELTNPGGSVKVGSMGIVDVTGNVKINIGSGSEPLVKGNALKSWLETHTHPSGVGPTGPPIQAAALLSIQSVKAFVE